MENLTEFQVLNLFLALLLSSFGASNLAAPTADAETNKIAEAFIRIGRFKRWVRAGIRHFFCVYLAGLLTQLKNRIIPPPPPPPEPEVPLSALPLAKGKKQPRLAETARLVMNSKKLMSDLKRLQEEPDKPDADKDSMASYGSHNYIILKPKAKKKKESKAKVRIHFILNCTE